MQFTRLESMIRGTLRRWLLLAGATLAISANAQPTDFTGAQWIWTPQAKGGLSVDYPGGPAWFRAKVAVSEKAPIKSAEMVITADNLFTLYINGQFAGESEPDPNAWSRGKRFDVARMLSAGHNTIAVEAVNTVPGPAGLLARLVVQLTDGQRIELATDATWKCAAQEESNWQQPDLNDQGWGAVRSLGAFGTAPWNRFTPRAEREVAGKRDRGNEIEPPANYPWPEAVIFVGDDCSLYRPVGGVGNKYDSLSVTIFNPRDSRSFPEHDLPSPMKVGHKLYGMKPAKPGTTPRLLLDAGKGALGSPSVSFDGRWIYVSMVPEGDGFYHIYRLPAEGGKAQQLTSGPFHDIDPCELPDGRIVFTSTRIGTFEEYHNPPSRSLFTMSADGGNLQPLTHTLVFDNEPEVLADGRILFIRSDNFFDRGKVETLLHAMYPDGTLGYTEFGLDLGPEYGSRLRAFNCGSPAPMPDGRVAFLTGSGISLGRPGCTPPEMRHLSIVAGDVAALPDGRLLCTLPRRTSYARRAQAAAGVNPKADTSYEKIAIADPGQREDKVVVLFDSTNAPVHSPVFLGARTVPPLLTEKTTIRKSATRRPTGVLYCENARLTKNTTAGWPQVRAIRVLAGRGLTTRSSHSYIVHAGSDVSDLGTVPLAPDGSFAVEVPADTPIAFQAVDAEGRSELNEMSWIYVRPGESRGCVGCHQTRQSAPPHDATAVAAMRTAPLKLIGDGTPHRFRGNNAAVTGLMELQFDRYREVAGLNRHSILSDPLATGAQEVAALVKQLEQNDPATQASAARVLGIFRDRTAAPALAGCLQSSSRDVRVAAAMALAACGTRDSVAPLLETLNDSDPLVAQAAAVALENLTGHREQGDPFAGKEARFRLAGAWKEWVRQTPWNAMEQDLVRRLASTHRDTMRIAAVALGHIGGDPARQALREYVLKEREKNPFPEWRKRYRGDEARFNALSSVNPRTLQAAVRSLGWLRDTASVAMLGETIRRNSDPETANLFLAEAAAEALGRIATREAEAELVRAFAGLQVYPNYTRWYGDHDALIACHASPVHYFIIEALDAMGSTNAGAILPAMIASVPTDPDRALMLYNDDYEILVGRVLRRHGKEAEVANACLALLGDSQATKSPTFQAAIRITHEAWGGKPEPDNRAAQILSLTCRDRAFEPRIRATFERYAAHPVDIPRVFDTGIPVVNKLPARHWVGFFLARTLGNMGDPNSLPALVAALEKAAPEAASGFPDPLGPGVLFLHNDLTPCWRAAAAWALGRIGDSRAEPALLKTVSDLANATDTRHAAAQALGRLAGRDGLETIRKLAESYPEVSVRQALQESARARTAL